MKFSETIMLLKSKIAIKDSKIDIDSDFYDIMFLDDTIKKYDENILYIGHYSQLKDKGGMPKFIMFYGLENDYHFGELSNYIQVQEESYPIAFNMIREELMKSLKAERTYGKMLRMILNGKGLEAILSEFTKKTGNALVVLDIFGKVIAHSTPFNVSDPLWIKSIERGYCPIEFMEHIKNVRSKNSFPKTSEAFVSYCEVADLLYLCSKVLSDDILLGYVFMFQGENPIDEGAKQLLPIISRTTSEVILRGKDSINLRSQLYCNVLIDMLEGINPSEVRLRIENSGLHFPIRMSVLYVKPSYYHGESYMKEELQKTLLHIFDKAPSVYYNRGIVLIASVNENYEIDVQAIEALKTLAKEQHLKIGISNSFNDPAHFASYYKQAEFALLLSQRLNKEDHINYYSDYAFFDILSKLPLELHLGRFCHPVLARLRKYDHEHNTQLYDTLKIFAQTGFNQKKTAEILFLHRNTLSYRKQRIEEIGGISLDDESLLFQLLYSFQIDSFIENRN